LTVEPVELVGQRVRLEPLGTRHADGLAAALGDGELWNLWVTTLPRPEGLPKYLADAEAARRDGRELPFATIDRATGLVVGCTRYRNMELAHRRVEIGATFIAKSWQRSHVNTEAKYLMLRHAFEAWQCNRVELVTDRLNETSRAAILRIGAREEGVLRQHMVMPDGRVRDSVMHAIVRDDWPGLKSRLEARLAGAINPSGTAAE
jgi:RimJ/RimL family protein N-acetyltransferase